MAERSTDLLIVGAGPYGLALAAVASHLGIDHFEGEPVVVEGEIAYTITAIATACLRPVRGPGTRQDRSLDRENPSTAASRAATAGQPR